MVEEIENLTQFEKGVILGLLIGEGHFGGDRKQPQITLGMHVRHEPLLHWVNNRIRFSRLYGPYHHQGRDFLRLMFRGGALKYAMIPLLLSLPWESIDPHSFERFRKMLNDYGCWPDDPVFSVKRNIKTDDV